MMKLSRRMKDILFLLSKWDTLPKSHIIYSIERNQWDKITRPSSRTSRPFGIPLDKVRVSYDRTLRHLRELGLIEGGWPSDKTPLSFYSGTLYTGYFYNLTDKGRKEAEEIMERILKPLMRYSDMLVNATARVN